jgi:hypothetical protein
VGPRVSKGPQREMYSDPNTRRSAWRQPQREVAQYRWGRERAVAVRVGQRRYAPCRPRSTSNISQPAPAGMRRVQVQVWVCGTCSHPVRCTAPSHYGRSVLTRSADAVTAAHLQVPGDERRHQQRRGGVERCLERLRRHGGGARLSRVQDHRGNSRRVARRRVRWEWSRWSCCGVSRRWLFWECVRVCVCVGVEQLGDWIPGRLDARRHTVVHASNMTSLSLARCPQFRAQMRCWRSS